MANLELCDKHNMVAYLKKPNGSEGFQEIVDFLNGSHIRTIDNEEQEITAIVDGKEFTVTEASVMRHLQLADADGISVLPNTKNFDQLSLIGGIKDCSRFGDYKIEIESQEAGKEEEKGKNSTTLKTHSDSLGRFNDETDFDAVFISFRLLLHKLRLKGRHIVKKINLNISWEFLVQPSGGISIASRLFSTAKESVSTAGASMPVSTAGASMLVNTACMVQEVNISIPSSVAVKDKGKGEMEEYEDEQTKRTKLQLEQDRLGHKAAVRLQEELDKEERQRMARVHEAAQSFTEEEWENIRARVEVDEELTQRLQAKERNMYSEVDQEKMLKLSFNEIKELFETTVKRVNTFVPIETEVRGRASVLVARSSQATITNFIEVESFKRATEAELNYEGSKRQKTNKALGSVQEQPDEEENELSQEDLQQMTMVVPVEEVYVEALQVKYLIIDWEVYTKE
nr:hypothetical protein [Tanacetum cinerariifolium]